MIDLSLYIDIVGESVVQDGWYVRDKIKIQRLYYIRKGKGSFTDAVGNRIPFEPGKIYIHPYNLVADYESDHDDPIDHIYFDFISTPPIISNKPLVYDVESGSIVETTLNNTSALLKELNSRTTAANGATRRGILASDPKHSRMFKCLLSLLLDELSMISPLPYSPDEKVCDTLEYIRSHYSRPITVTELAERAGFELNYFIRRFKSVMGMTPYAYLRSYRLLKAKTLVSQGKTLAETAAAVGYDSASSLSRALGKAER